MPALRFNHMELTLPMGALERDREAITAFYGEVFGFEAIDVPLFDSTGLLLRTDAETSQFLLLMEQEEHLQSPGYDHLGFLFETREEVDQKLALCKQWQQKDDRLRLKEYDDLVISPTVTHAFYVHYLLPIWFDIQVIEYEAGSKPQKDWVFG
ncbi:MAG: VOC family protein [Halioglobus sp.]|nr:VOC family protein [Halioglobus sp.]